MDEVATTSLPTPVAHDQRGAVHTGEAQGAFAQKLHLRAAEKQAVFTELLPGQGFHQPVAEADPGLSLAQFVAQFLNLGHVAHVGHHTDDPAPFVAHGRAGDDAFPPALVGLRQGAICFPSRTMTVPEGVTHPSRTMS